MVDVPGSGPLLKWLGGEVDVRVYIDTGLTGASLSLWGSATWGSSTWGSDDPQWNDISEYVMQVTIDGGAREWGQPFDARVASVLLDNRSGIFTPESGVDPPWVLSFRPGRKIQIAAIVNDEKKPLFTGTIDATFDGFTPDDVQTTIPCTDFSALWQQHNPAALVTPTGVQSTSERVAAALDRFDWPAEDRDIQTGLHDMQSSHLAQSTMEEMRLAAMAEQGAVFASADGKAVFKARDWLIEDERSTEVQGYIGYDSVPGASTPVAHLIGQPDIAREQGTIKNQIQFARVGSTVYTTEDSQSISLYQRHPHRVLNFQNNDDADVEFMADTYLAVNKLPRQKIRSVSIIPVKDPNNFGLNKMFWDTQYGDLVAVRIATPYGWELKRLTKVFGVSHQITGDDWIMTLYLDDVFSRVNGSEAKVKVEFFGGGRITTYSDGSEAFVRLSTEGGGYKGAVSDGAEATIEITAEGGGYQERATLVQSLNPVAYWSMGDIGSINDDDSGNGHDLTWTGSPTSGSVGPLGDSYRTLDGVNDYAIVAGEADLEIYDDTSIEIWFRPHDTSGLFQNLISCYDASNSEYLYGIAWDPGSTGQVYAYPADGKGTSTTMSEKPITANEWNHLVVTWDWNMAAPSRTIMIYVNGELVDIEAFSFMPTDPASAAYVVNIGRHVTNGVYFDGNIAEMAIFDRVLSAQEVSSLYRSSFS